jgi:hypothetical protein
MMGRKTVKTAFVTVFVAAVALAGTVSARQLRTDAKGFAACRGACTSGTQCSSGCICAFPLESTSGFCSSHPTGFKAPAK